ncbi:hypothetical protein B0H10DRAFT_2245520 [Mycena sp. CBHHK59/15]|nr:hypothetical protein B0H10DRAFT_2245520 [Mycena sp. CBHHK59/15]
MLPLPLKFFHLLRELTRPCTLVVFTEPAPRPAPGLRHRCAIAPGHRLGAARTWATAPPCTDRVSTHSPHSFPCVQSWRCVGMGHGSPSMHGPRIVVPHAAHLRSASPVGQLAADRNERVRCPHATGNGDRFRWLRDERAPSQSAPKRRMGRIGSLPCLPTTSSSPCSHQVARTFARAAPPTRTTYARMRGSLGLTQHPAHLHAFEHDRATEASFSIGRPQLEGAALNDSAAHRLCQIWTALCPPSRVEFAAGSRSVVFQGIRLRGLAVVLLLVLVGVVVLPTHLG